jgi:hypothetical protein
MSEENAEGRVARGEGKLQVVILMMGRTEMTKAL